MTHKKSTLCLVASALAGSTILLGMSMPEHALAKYENTLSGHLLERYNHIRAERTRIALSGIALGAFLALPFAGSWCVSLVVVFSVQHLYYSLAPKSDWMLRHHTTPEQNAAWVALYREMRLRSHLFFVLGAIVYVMVAARR